MIASSAIGTQIYLRYTGKSAEKGRELICGEAYTTKMESLREWATRIKDEIGPDDLKRMCRYSWEEELNLVIDNHGNSALDMM